MKGYVENKTPMWAHAMKRSIGPGAKVPLNDLYEQYGVKHGIEKGDEFVAWLKTVKLTDTNRWNVVFDGMREEVTEVLPTDDQSPQELDSIDNVRRKRPSKSVGFEAVEPTKRVDITEYNDERSTQQEERDDIDKMPNKLDVGDIVLLSVRKARDVVPHITDKKLLQYALGEAGTRPGKDSLCKVLRTRISQLEAVVR